MSSAQKVDVRNPEYSPLPVFSIKIYALVLSGVCESVKAARASIAIMSGD